MKEEKHNLVLLVIDNDNKAKAVCLTCKERVSCRGSKPETYNTSNLHEHPEGHEGKFKEYAKKENKQELQFSKGKDGYKQVMLETLAETFLGQTVAVLDKPQFTTKFSSAFVYSC